MPLTTLQEIFTTPWGIVEGCRAEIESSGAGEFNRILNRETDLQFPSARLASKLMNCCDSTVRKWPSDHDARFIYLCGVMRYYIEDVNQLEEFAPRARKNPPNSHK